MLSLRNNFLICLVLLLCAGCAIFPFQKGGGEVAFYVSTEGNDSWSGASPSPNWTKTDGPFATLERARDAIRESKEKAPAPPRFTVYVREGLYTISDTFVLTSADAGSSQCPITYRAYKNEKPHLIGGKRIAGFKPVDDPNVLKRISASYRDAILQVDLKAEGLTEYGEMKPRGFGRPMYPAGLELFFNDKPMTLAQWPNEGWATIAEYPKKKQETQFKIYRRPAFVMERCR